MNAPVRSDVLEGEVLAPGEAVQLVVVPHPLLTGGREVLAVAAGDTVAELVRLAELRHGARWRFVAYLEGRGLPRSCWTKVRPKPGTQLVLQTVAGEGAGRSIALIAVAALALIVAPWLAGALFPGLAVGSVGLALVTNIIGAGITIGGALLVNKLFPLPDPQIADQSGSEAAFERRPSISGARNQATPYGGIPVVLGTTRTYPRLAAQPYTEVSGHDQYLRLLLCWGYGPLDIASIKIGETPIANFDDVDIETFYGYDSDDDPSLYPSVTFEEQLAIELEPQVSNVRVSAADIDELLVDLAAPSGLYYQSKADGHHSVRTVYIRLRYRAYPGGGSWTDWETHPFAENSIDVVRRGFRKKVSRGQYEVEVTRVTGAYDGDANTVVEDIYWTSLKGLRNEPPIDFDAAPLAVTALRIKASSQLSGSIDRINGVCSSRVTAYNGATWSADTASNNPADLFRWVLQGPFNASPVADALIDLAGLQDWWSYCDTEGFAFNSEITSSSVYEVLRQIAAAGRAMPVFVDGKWSVVWDQPEASIVWHFTPRNSWNFRGERAYRRLPHALRVRFFNEDKGYIQDERVVYDDGYSAANATRFEAVEFPGVTDPDLIWRHARFHIAEARLRPEVYSLDCDFEQLRLVRGDRVRLTHDAALIGQVSGRVKAVADPVITLDEAVIMESGKSYGIRFRLSTGDTLYRSVTLEVGETKELTLDGTGDVPAAGDLFAFGEASLESIVCRVLSIEPREDLQAHIRLVDDAAAIADADTGVIPAYSSGVTAPPDPLTLPPRDLRVSVFYTTGAGGVRTGAYLSWRIPRSGAVDRFEIQHRPDYSDRWRERGRWVPAPQTEYIVSDLDPDIYDFRVRAVFKDGSSSAWAESLANNLEATTAPPDVSTFRISPTGDVATLSWARVDAVNVRGYQVRFAPATSGVTWYTAAPLFDELIVNNAVQIVPRTGTYLIKAESYQGLQSENATSLVSTATALSTFNAVETVTETAPFSGTHSGTVYDAVRGGLRIDAEDDFFDPVDFFDPEGFFSGVAGTHTYQFASTLDLGEVFTSRLTADLEVSGIDLFSSVFDRVDVFSILDVFGDDPTVWEAYIEVRTTSDDPSGSPTWSGWERLVAADYTARAFQFRIVLVSTAYSITPLVTEANITVDMPDRVVAEQDLVVTTSGRSITFSPAFRSLQGLAIVAQDLATGDYAVVSNKDEEGFDIIFRNSGGSAVERTFDYVAKGYGRVDS